MQKRIYDVLVSVLLFWVLTELFAGIEVNEGALGFLVCGGIFGIVMLAVEPLIRFFTLPVKFITLFFTSVMLSVIVFFFLNFGVPFIDFKDGAIEGLSNRYFEFPEVSLNMIGNVLVGGLLAGVLSATLKWLEDGSD
jgi:uncharacterized membrane protein YvlD (DUF360 family)